MAKVAIRDLPGPCPMHEPGSAAGAEFRPASHPPSGTAISPFVHRADSQPRQNATPQRWNVKRYEHRPERNHPKSQDRQEAEDPRDDEENPQTAPDARRQLFLSPHYRTTDGHQQGSPAAPPLTRGSAIISPCVPATRTDAPHHRPAVAFRVKVWSKDPIRSSQSSIRRVIRNLSCTVFLACSPRRLRSPASLRS
jgi:hypothetical protein